MNTKHLLHECQTARKRYQAKPGDKTLGDTWDKAFDALMDPSRARETERQAMNQARLGQRDVDPKNPKPVTW